MLDLLQADHREMRKLIEQQRGLRVSGLVPSQIAELRWHFERCVARHLHTLRTEVYPSLRRNNRSGSDLVAATFSAKVDEVVAAYERHKQRFPTDRADPQQSAYQTSSDRLSTQVLHLIADEERDLLSLLAGS